MGLVGFTTLTFKIGGSVKTGPTVLFKQYQKKGYGNATRRAIEEYVRGLGVRKLYCTGPDTDTRVTQYLLRAGYQIEAHLREHYRVGSGEFVFGRIISGPSDPARQSERTETSACEIVQGSEFSPAVLAEHIQDLFVSAGFPIDADSARSIADSSRSDPERPYEEKPLAVFAMRKGSRCFGVLVNIPKRGGAMKAMCATTTSHLDSIRRLIQCGEQQAKDHARRKIYFLQPHLDTLVSTLLRDMGYTAEGILREPYTPSIDCVVLSKLL